MNAAKLTLSILEGRFAICRLSARAEIPLQSLDKSFFSITRTPDELSIVCAEDSAPRGERCETGWQCLKVQGPLDFSITGVMASLAMPLAEAGISIFSVSTFDTDYLLVKEADIERAIRALSAAGHSVRHR
jgi:uncharacterized protein